MGPTSGCSLPLLLHLRGRADDNHEETRKIKDSGIERERDNLSLFSLDLDDAHTTGRRDNNEKDRPTCLSAVNHVCVCMNECMSVPVLLSV